MEQSYAKNIIEQLIFGLLCLEPGGTICKPAVGNYYRTYLQSIPYLVVQPGLATVEKEKSLFLAWIWCREEQASEMSQSTCFITK